MQCEVNGLRSLARSSFSSDRNLFFTAPNLQVATHSSDTLKLLFTNITFRLCIDFLTRFNKIAIQAIAQLAADKEPVGLSRVHM